MEFAVDADSMRPRLGQPAIRGRLDEEGESEAARSVAVASGLGDVLDEGMGEDDPYRLLRCHVKLTARDIGIVALRENIDGSAAAKSRFFRIAYVGMYCPRVGSYTHLLSGVDSWNRQRDKEDFEPNLMGARIYEEFQKADKLEGGYIPLYHANLQDALLAKADLRKANLESASLQGTNLFNATLEGAVLQFAFIQGSFLQHALLQEANLFRADLSGANLQGARLNDAHLVEADLTGANLRDGEFIPRNCSVPTCLEPNLGRPSSTPAPMEGASNSKH